MPKVPVVTLSVSVVCCYMLELELELWSLVTSCKKNNTVETSCWGTQCRVIVRRIHSKLSQGVATVGLVTGSDNSVITDDAGAINPRPRNDDASNP